MSSEGDGAKFKAAAGEPQYPMMIAGGGDGQCAGAGVGVGHFRPHRRGILHQPHGRSSQFIPRHSGRAVNCTARAPIHRSATNPTVWQPI